MSDVLYEGSVYTVYRFVKSVHDMRVSGVVITQPETIDFWKKRFIWMEWVTRMDNWQLELMAIGWSNPSPPFYTAHYTETYVNGMRDHMRNILFRRGPTPERTILVEEVYTSETDALNAGVGKL